jgi:hypothetical protein
MAEVWNIDVEGLLEDYDKGLNPFHPTVVAGRLTLVGRVTHALTATGRVADKAPPSLWQVDCPQAPAALTVHFLTANQLGPAKVGDKVELVYTSSPPRGEWRVKRVLEGGE